MASRGRGLCLFLFWLVIWGWLFGMVLVMGHFENREELEGLGFGHNKMYVVLGMHRSGTSFVARALHESGVDMGEGHFVGANRFNPLGHYENADFVVLNDEIMKEAGAVDWSGVVAPEKIEEIRESGKYRSRVKELLGRFSSKFWGFKDPRTISTLPLYLEQVDEDENDVYLVCVFRKPQRVEGSLKRRNGFDEKKSRASINRHNKLLLRQIVDFLGL